MNDSAPFFIGWESKPPSPLSRFLRGVTVAAIALGILLGLGAAAWQAHIGDGSWDLNAREFTGVLWDSPTPMLLTVGEDGGVRPYFLVAEGKFGFSTRDAKAWHLREVTLTGSLIENGQASMIEVSGEVAVAKIKSNPSLSRWEELGPAVIQGEIVDSKCYLGAMNPGVGKPHRACAIHCIRGGIPPMLLAADGRQILLVGLEGEAIHTQVLDFVAEPVELTGNLRFLGPILVLNMDPRTIKRLPR